MTGGAEPGPEAFLAELVVSARRQLPPTVAARVLMVERRRTLADRLAQRTGAITQVTLETETERLTLRYEPGPRWFGESARLHAGVVIARFPLGLDDWVAAFSRRVAALAAAAAGEEAASSRARQALGLEPVGSEVVVREAEVEADLRTLPARLGDRVPPEAVTLVARIGELLSDCLGRVAGQGEPEVVVLRTATVYLPDTLRAYLALPPDWAASHVLADGTTPAAALVKQLRDLEEASRRMRDAAVEHDASALLINGRFLSERFSSSRLDLP